MSLFGLEFSQMILHTETSKLMYWSFLFDVLHKPTLLPSTFKAIVGGFEWIFINLLNSAAFSLQISENLKSPYIKVQ